jgi:hypothetical protein
VAGTWPWMLCYALEFCVHSSVPFYIHPHLINRLQF